MALTALAPATEAGSLLPDPPRQQLQFSGSTSTIGPAADLTPFYCNCRVFKQLRSQARFGLFP